MSKQSENIEIHAPDAVAIAMSPEEAGVLREVVEIPAILEGLRARILALRPTVAEAAEMAEAAARAELMKTIEARQLRTGRELLRANWRRFDAAADRLRGDHQLSEVGRRERIEVEAIERDENNREQFNRLDGHAQALLQRSPQPSPPALTPEVGSAVQTLAAVYPFALPEDFAAGALDALSIASDPDASEAEREAKTALLKHGYLPFVRRRAVMPEKFAHEYRPVYAEILELIEEHLSNRGAKHRAAVALREQFRANWRTLDQLALQGGRWDEMVAGIGGAGLFDD